MTSDAKIGLLLSLIFIFIIAFIINGLPNFFRGTDSNKLTQDYLNKLRSYDSDITHGAREAVEVISNLGRVKGVEAGESRGNKDNSIRYEQSLPRVGPAVSDSRATNMAASLLPVDGRLRETQSAYSVKPSRPKFYVVKDDDSLSTIAEKFYGPKEGCKKQSIEMIFKANKSVLSSPDLIAVGQRLFIPPLKSLNERPRQVIAESGQRLFERADELGSKSLSLASTVQTKSGRYREYVVKEGDSLWKIAKEQLGNPGRYVEIARLNKDIIEDEEQLVVGIHIKMPSR